MILALDSDSDIYNKAIYNNRKIGIEFTSNIYLNKFKQVNMGVFLHLFLSYILIVNINDAANILVVVPTPSISHQVVFRPLTQELAKRGHDVTVITADPAFPEGGAPANLTEIDLHDLSYNIYRQESDKMPKGNKDDILVQMKTFLVVLAVLFREQLKDEKVQHLINNKKQKFDLLILEASVRQALVYSHIFKAPVIQMSSVGGFFDHFSTIGAPEHPLLYPTIFQQKVNNLTMWEKIQELYNHYMIQRIYQNNAHFENKILQEHFGPDVPTVTELYNNVHMLFLNVYQVFEGIRPVPPTVVYTGGLHQKPEKELPKVFILSISYRT